MRKTPNSILHYVFISVVECCRHRFFLYSHPTHIILLGFIVIATEIERQPNSIRMRENEKKQKKNFSQLR